MWATIGAAVLGFVKEAGPTIATAVRGVVIGHTDKEIKTKHLIDSSKRTPNWQKWFPFAMVYGNGSLQPLYLYGLLFVLTAIAFVGVKIYLAYLASKYGKYTAEMLPTADLGLLLSIIPGLLVVYHKTKRKQEEAGSAAIASEVKPEIK
jgi:hypothetical protein